MSQGFNLHSNSSWGEKITFLAGARRVATDITAEVLQDHLIERGK